MLSHHGLCRLAARKAEHADYSPAVIDRILRYGAPVGSSFTCYRQLPRCMDVLRRRVMDNSGPPPVTGCVVRADSLTASSGRFNRRWHAPVGGLYLALLWADTLLPEFSRFLPFAVGISCCESVREFLPAARLKWVNDVHAGGKKICGVLCETVVGAEGDRFHLIGIGLNVNGQWFPEELGKTATSLQAATGTTVDLNGVCALLLARLQWNFGLLYYAEEQKLAAGRGDDSDPGGLVLRRWLQLSDTPGKRVLYGYDVQQKPLYQATALELDPAGGLVMELDDGSRIIEHSGEIIYLADDDNAVVEHDPS